MSRARIEVAASILNADLGALREAVQAAESAGVDRIHLDIMDGHFVPPLSFGKEVIAAVRAATPRFIEAHLMVARPGEQFADLAAAGAQRLVFHYEAAGSVEQRRPSVESEVETDATDAASSSSAPASAARSAGGASVQGKKLLAKYTRLTDKLKLQTDALDALLAHSGASTEKHAKYMRDKVIPAMNALRATGDEIELLSPHGLWPLPTYREMLFVK